MVREDSSDSDLVKITEAWPTLPERAKAQIRGLIEKYYMKGKDE